MSQSNTLRGYWRVASASFVAACALSLFMIFLGVRGLADPLGAAEGFGLPVAHASDSVWLQVKAGRDLCAGLSLAALLALRNARLMGIFLLANLAIPSNDLWQSLSSPVHDATYALSVHGSAALLMLSLAVSLLRTSDTPA